MMQPPPFLPAPCPDEILGSWLARLRLYNGDGWWRVAMRAAGYSARSDGYAFDIPKRSPSMEAFFCSVGMSCWDQVLRTMTTLPYWLTFDAVPNSGQDAPVTLTLTVHGTHNGVVRNVSAMARRYRAWAGIRFCPRCLEVDRQTCGEPYWHRAHQLPNVMRCPDHFIRLQTSCVRCGRSCIPDGQGHVPLPRMTCQCGFAQTSITACPDETDIWQKLAIISRDALVSSPGCSRPSMRAYLRSQMRSCDLRQIIGTAFGERLVVDSFPSSASSSGEWLWVPLSKHFSQLRAPDCCALFAALDLDLASAQRAATAADGVSLDRRDRGRPRAVASVDAARKALLKFTLEYPQANPSRSSFNYWVLRLQDPGWLRQHFPQSRLTPFPSVRADREWIRTSMDGQVAPGKARTYCWRLIAQNAAGRRAAIRDNAWFEKQRRSFFNIAQGPCVQPRAVPGTARRKTRSPVTARHVAALRHALKAMIADGVAPARITIENLASQAGMTLRSVKRVLRQDQDIALEIREARADTSRRRIEWAVRILDSKGQSITMSSIAAVARISRTRRNFELVMDAVRGG